MADAFVLMDGAGSGTVTNPYDPGHADDYPLDAYAGAFVDPPAQRWAGRVWAPQRTLDSLADESDVTMNADEAVTALNNHYGSTAAQAEWERRFGYVPD